MVTKTPLKIGIVGAGFSGTALTAQIHRFGQRPIEITLFDKSGLFGKGDAYRTPYPHHLLNVRAQDMSMFEDDAAHFVRWLSASPEAKNHLNPAVPIGEQFVPRQLYGLYLQDVLQHIQAQSPNLIKLQCEPSEVVDIHVQESQACLLLKNRKEILVDKVILALGNNPPSAFPFPITSSIECIKNPWDYTALNNVKPDDPILIVGTGLSMIDAVLTLYHQHHKGKIYALSRHGLLPLAHADSKVPYVLLQEELPTSMRTLAQHLRHKTKRHAQDGGDWRSVINALRPDIPSLWARISQHSKRQFLRHVLPYWNVHRHRVHHDVADLLARLQQQQQLQIFSGRVLAIEQDKAILRLRGQSVETHLPIRCVVNCMGPGLTVNLNSPSLIKTLVERGLVVLDDLQLGFATNQLGAIKTAAGEFSQLFYTLGPLRKGVAWECSAVPEIRKQSADLAKILLS